MVVPTLAADDALQECLASLALQSVRDFEVIVVDNSGAAKVPAAAASRVIHNETNVGFGAAINQAYRVSDAPFLATLNDDAVAEPRWLESLLEAMGARYEIGMCASQVSVRLAGVRLEGQDALDSAGMLLCADGSSKQRGHGEPPARVWAAAGGAVAERVGRSVPPRHAGGDRAVRRELFPVLRRYGSGLARRAGRVGNACTFRMRWWSIAIRIRPGKRSALKAYYVERNRLFLVVKNFPCGPGWRVPFVCGRAVFLACRVWHARARGAAAQFAREGNGMGRLPLYVLRAHAELIRNLPALWRKRRAMKRRLSARQFRRLLRHIRSAPRQVAAL